MTYVALTLCFKLRSFLHWYSVTYTWLWCSELVNTTAP